MLVSQMLVLKVRLPDVGYEPFASHGEAPGFQFFANCGSLFHGRLCEILSQHFLPAPMWVSS